LFITSNLLDNIQVFAVYKYGYKQGDTYNFYVEMSSSAITEEGKSSTSASYSITFKIKDIEENSNGYRVDIEYLGVTATFYGLYGNMVSSQIINEGHMEGDPQPFVSNNYLGPFSGISPAQLFITTDWEERGDEWKTYVDNNYGNKPGHQVQSRTQSNGVFTLDITFDVERDDSDIDWDGDDTRDAYTGSMSMRIEYDANGVLSSFVTQSKITFDPNNKAEATIKAGRGSASSLLGIPMDILTYVLMVVIGIAALVVGFLVGRRKRVAKSEFIPPQPTATPPQPS